VKNKLNKHNNDREKCIEILSSESPKFLFGGNMDTVTSHMQTFNIGHAETRQRSDSGSSGVSSTSNCSASSVSSWPPTNTNTGGMSFTSHSEARPQTAPVEPRDLNPFFLGGRNTGNIPNIHCDAYNPGSSPHVSNYQAGNVPLSGNNPTKGLRQIHVVHVQTPEVGRTPPGQISPCVNQQGQYVYKIQVSPRPSGYSSHDQYPSQQQVSPQLQQQHSYPASSSWRSNSPYNIGPHGNYINHSYGNDHGMFSLDRYSGMRHTQQETSPQGHCNTISFQNQYSPTQPNYPTTQQQQNPFSRPNKSSQATIYIRNTTSAAKLDTPGDRTPIYSPGNQGFPINMHMSQSEPFLSQQSNSFMNQVTSSGNPNATSQQPSQNYSKPLFVKLESYGPDNKFESQGASSSSNMFPSSLGGAVNPPSNSYVTKLQSAGGGPSQGDNGQVFIHYPPVPSTCRVPGHPPVPSRTPSIENEHKSKIGNPEIEPRHLSHATFPPLVSPASSHSSLSSESSQREVQRRRSGSLQEEAAYTQALLTFQKERMFKLKTDLESELRKLSKLRAEVEDVSKLREKNLRLQTDIQMFTREIDMFNNGQTPLGVLDPLEQQNFYKNMNTAPPPIPPRIHHVPPPPPPQPAASGSGDSDGDGEQWNCSACTFLNHPALNKCECCEMPRMNVQQPQTEQPEDNFSDWTYIDRDPETRMPIEGPSPHLHGT
ncbi:hypothetical protein KUTeg_007354, partial [Tegillarca granosa]